MNNMGELEGKVVVVTGAGAGIGLGVTRACVKAGATVIGATLSEKEEAAVTAAGATFIKTDVGDPSSIADMMAAVASQFGRLDGLVNNAGVTSHRPFQDMTLDELDLLWRVNQRSVFLVTQSAAPLMESGGAVVNMGSNHARATLAGYEMYAATKGAIAAMTRAMAWSLGPSGIRVNALCPGLTRTEAIAALATQDETLEMHFENSHATGTYNSVEDVGNLAVFLLSARAKALSGAEIFADQGMSARLGAF